MKHTGSKPYFYCFKHLKSLDDTPSRVIKRNGQLCAGSFQCGVMFISSLPDTHNKPTFSRGVVKYDIVDVLYLPENVDPYFQSYIDDN